jgi:hypothetical protein
MTEIRQDSSEEAVGAVFQPDTVLPSQFFGILRQKGFVEGEKRLMAAVLADAVDCYMKQAFNPETRGQQLFRDAEAWIFQDEPGPWLFSFRNICDMLGLEPEYIRRGLRTWCQTRRPSLRASDAFRRSPRATRSSGTREALKKAG